jgi:transposase
MRSYQAVIRLSAEEREELTRWAKSRTLPAGDVFKASLILALADGKSYSAVEAELNTSRPTIARWRARFEQARIAGLESHHRGSRPRQATPAVQARILKKTQQKPADGSTHWSCRKMAAAVGVSPATVHRIWAKAGLKPHRLDRYMASNDPAFEQKAAESSRCTWIRRSMRLCSASTKRRRFRPWTASIRSCRYRRGGPKNMGLNIIGMAHFRSTRRWM